MTPNNLKLNPNPPVEWRVQWEIDILANTAEDAAREARDIQRDPHSTASVFKVCGDGANIWTEIDIGAIDPTPEIPTAPAPVDNPVDHPEQAEREGWRLWIKDGRYQIVMLDDPAHPQPDQFASDSAAQDFVALRAMQGSVYHLAAINAVNTPAPPPKFDAHSLEPGDLASTLNHGVVEIRSVFQTDVIVRLKGGARDGFITVLGIEEIMGRYSVPPAIPAPEAPTPQRPWHPRVALYRGRGVIVSHPLPATSELTFVEKLYHVSFSDGTLGTARASDLQFFD